MANQLNRPKSASRIWAPPVGETTTLELSSSAVPELDGKPWPVGTRMLLRSADGTATVLGPADLDQTGELARWGPLDSTQCDQLRASTNFVIQVPTALGWDGVVAGNIIVANPWRGVEGPNRYS